MSFLNPLKTCVFSAVKARLTKHGKPLQGVTVIRRWDWNDKEHEDRTVTDAQGEFSFPAVFESSITRLLPMEIVIGQGLYVVEDGAEQTFWINAKRDEVENSEYQGRPTHLLCELTHKMNTFQDGVQMKTTMCIWSE